MTSPDTQKGDSAKTQAPNNLAQRQHTTAEVFTKCQDVVELDDGYAFRFPKTKAWQDKVEFFTAAWGKSCPHMTFEVVDNGAKDGQILMHIRGPEGTKAFVEGARYMLTSHINPAPTLKYKLERSMRLLTGPLRTLPDFLIIGAKKCGTTALYSYLTQHPKIAPAFKKEIYFFNAYYGKGHNWYKAYFPTKMAKGDHLTGEATPDYLFHARAAERVRETIPDARLIAILRNPIDRAFSFYNHNVRSGVEELSFEDAIAQETERIAGEQDKVLAEDDYFSFDYIYHSYLLRGIYVSQLELWTKHFPKSQILALKTENLYEKPEETLRTAFEFLGLEYHAPKEFKKLNAFPYPDMDPGTRERLQEYFAPHNQRLYEFLGQDLGW